MRRVLKELYGSLILFYYFFKWPFFLGFPYLYLNGLDENIILNILWFITALLIVKDLYNLKREL